MVAFKKARQQWQVVPTNKVGRSSVKEKLKCGFQTLQFIRRMRLIIFPLLRLTLFIAIQRYGIVKCIIYYSVGSGKRALSRWRRLVARSPRCRKKLQVDGRRRRTFKFIDCPARLITTSLKIRLSPSTAPLSSHYFSSPPRRYSFFIGLPLLLSVKTLSVRRDKFRCLGDLR